MKTYISVILIRSWPHQVSIISKAMYSMVGSLNLRLKYSILHVSWCIHVVYGTADPE